MLEITKRVLGQEEILNDVMDVEGKTGSKILSFSHNYYYYYYYYYSNTPLGSLSFDWKHRLSEVTVLLTALYIALHIIKYFSGIRYIRSMSNQAKMFQAKAAAIDDNCI
jgi:hypothetical protein